MKVARLSISNFRGIKSAEFLFDDHVLMVGSNNVGKSTICDALDLVLGPDRLNRFPPIEEFDFYNAEYLRPPPAEGQPPELVPLRIEVVLIELTQEIRTRCASNLEFWRNAERELLTNGEVDAANTPGVQSCLRLETVGKYNPEEDEFEASTFFSHSPHAEDGELSRVPKAVKRIFGFLYLRALRTGSRALSLEHGSLLDLILRLKSVRMGLWEKAIARLRDLDIQQDANELAPVLTSIEQRLNRYVRSEATAGATKLHVSKLTREHLRETMAFFLAMSKDQNPVPFQMAGTGTLNTLVLALLTFIADLKPETIIFAMEEPEIAVPPHTQRSIADYLLQKTTQAFVTSHSPYVIERFEPSQTLLLSRDEVGTVSGRRLSDASGLKDNDYKRYARKGIAECMLGKGVVVVEGLTEYHALPVAARKIVESDQSLQPLDTAGVAFIDAESDGKVPKFGAFFKALGLTTFSFYDFKARNAAEKAKFTQAFDVDFEHRYASFEELVTQEMSPDILWSFLENLKSTGESGNVGIPAQRPVDSEIQKFAKIALSSNKGAGWAARLFEEVQVNSLPQTVRNFLAQIFSLFPKPPEPAPEVPASTAPQAPAQTGAPGAAGPAVRSRTRPPLEPAPLPASAPPPPPPPSRPAATPPAAPQIPVPQAPPPASKQPPPPPPRRPS